MIIYINLTLSLFDLEPEPELYSEKKVGIQTVFKFFSSVTLI